MSLVKTTKHGPGVACTACYLLQGSKPEKFEIRVSQDDQIVTGSCNRTAIWEIWLPNLCEEGKGIVSYHFSAGSHARCPNTSHCVGVWSFIAAKSDWQLIGHHELKVASPTMELTVGRQDFVDPCFSRSVKLPNSDSPRTVRWLQSLLRSNNFQGSIREA